MILSEEDRYLRVCKLLQLEELEKAFKKLELVQGERGSVKIAEFNQKLETCALQFANSWTNEFTLLLVVGNEASPGPEDALSNHLKRPKSAQNDEKVEEELTSSAKENNISFEGKSIIEASEQPSEAISLPPSEDLNDSNNAAPDKKRFGFKSMLSSLTKGRPKPRRTAEEKSDEVQPETGDNIVSQEVEEAEDKNSSPSPLESKRESILEHVPIPISTLEVLEQQPAAPKYVPTTAMSALASAMRAGLSRNDANSSEQEIPKSSVNTSVDGPKYSEPPLVAIKPRPRPKSTAIDDSNQPVETQTRPYTYHEGESGEARKIPPPVMPRQSASRSGAAPPVLPRIGSRPQSVHSDMIQESVGSFNSPGSALSGTEELGTLPYTTGSPLELVEEENRVVPKEPRSSGGELNITVKASRTKEEEARHELVMKAQRASVVKPARQNYPTGPALQFKKKENSLSGNDPALVKKALEWLNHHLKSRELPEITDVTTAFADGLNLIYALEAASGASVGKYNKRAVMQPHKLDNITVALTFLARKGVDVNEFNASDIVEGNRGKILTLFNRILKIFPTQ